jgi:hypothetical protein
MSIHLSVIRGFVEVTQRFYLLPLREKVARRAAPSRMRGAGRDETMKNHTPGMKIKT